MIPESPTKQRTEPLIPEAPAGSSDCHIQHRVKNTTRDYTQCSSKIQGNTCCMLFPNQHCLKNCQNERAVSISIST